MLIRLAAAAVALLIAGAAPAFDSPEVALQALPAEARETLRLVDEGGPFPYQRDGIPFGNYEKLLPKKPRGFYREYTVPTPGISHRGPRRLVCGGNPPAICYYTGDHYQSFRRIRR